MSKAAVYCRVSTDNQEREGTSLDSQLAACQLKAKELGYDSPLVFMETYSGLTMERPKLTELRKLAGSHDVDAVIVLKPDRLSRVGEDILTLAKEFKIRGIKLIFVKEQWDDTPSGKMVAFALGWAGEMYVEAMKEATMRGKKAKVSQGKMPTGCGVGIYGYDWDKVNKRRIVNDKEAAVLNRIFNMIADGTSLLKIAVTLNKEGVPTKSGGNSQWHPLTIRRIATNRAYIGETYYYQTRRVKENGKSKMVRRPESEWVSLPEATPPIINKELFTRVQVLLAKTRELHHGHPAYEYLLTTRIKCSDCGSPMVGGCLKGSYRYYRCRNSQPTAVRPKSCNAKYVRADDIEAVVWNIVKDTYEHPDALLAELDKEAKAHDNGETTAMDKEIARLKRQLGTYDNQKQRLISLFRIQDKIGENNILDEMNKLADDQKQDEERLSQLVATRERITSLASTKAQFTEYLGRVSGNLESLSFQEKKLALKGLNIQVVADKETYKVNGLVNVLTIEQTSAYLREYKIYLTFRPNVHSFGRKVDISPSQLLALKTCNEVNYLYLLSPCVPRILGARDGCVSLAFP